ncbi:CBS domain-containing protein [Parvularcula sp. LCG005]|uniref:CBS domain-containing protein n=1 Tax=Parvularcula sp. LCG005 TaxID=3078805 RepID=UPI002942C407|nr:CBS domain-containing protein [Parvularcula sp. LCG005]WOI54161.1 CBS domain-containing protein [Parvularcula sp. LCG005]
MRAGDILKSKGSEVFTISSDVRLTDAITMLAEHNIGAVIVSEGQGVVSGILSERDIIRVLKGAPTGYRETPVREVMTSHVFTCSPDATVDELLDLMTEKRIRHVPIVTDQGLVGLVSIGDVVKHRIREAVGEAEALKSYISHG